MVNVAREPMFTLGCIQAQRCHTDKCPVGVATQDPWLAHGLDVHSKAERVANYVRALRRDILKVAEACGVAHPGLITTSDVEVADGHRHSVTLGELYGYRSQWVLPGPADREQISRLMAEPPTTPARPGPPAPRRHRDGAAPDGRAAAEQPRDDRTAPRLSDDAGDETGPSTRRAGRGRSRWRAVEAAVAQRDAFGPIGARDGTLQTLARADSVRTCVGGDV